MPSRFKVIRHVRPKLACVACEAIFQAPAPSRPIARGMAGPGLLAAWYRYSPNRRGEHPQAHLANYSGVLQADAYGGYGKIYASGARCGSPAFEKKFFLNSQAAVRAGLVSKRTSLVEAEKVITGLRRNPFVLVTVNADCPAQLKRLKQVLKDRSRIPGSSSNLARLFLYAVPQPVLS